jgi:hypothetical protein
MDALVAHLKATRPAGSNTRDVRVLLNYLDSKKASSAGVTPAIMTRSSPEHAELLAYMSAKLKAPVTEIDTTLLKLASDIPL